MVTKIPLRITIESQKQGANEFPKRSREYEKQEPLGIVYVQGDAERAEPLGDSQFISSPR
jgi:hypothetical protein